MSCQIAASAFVAALACRWDLAIFGRRVKGLHVEQQLRHGEASSVQLLCIVKLKALAPTLSLARRLKDMIEGHDAPPQGVLLLLKLLLSILTYHPYACICAFTHPATVSQQVSGHTASTLINLCLPDLHARKRKQEEA